MKTAISRTQLISLIIGLRGKGATFATITIETEPKMNKTNNPYFGNVLKRATTNITLNFNYENSVNNQLKREGKEADFVAGPRAWGESLEGTCLVFNNDLMYLKYKLNSKPQEVEFYSKDTKQAIDKSSLEPYMPPRKTNSNQGTDKAIETISVKLTNVKELKMNGEHYVVVAD